jgi:hypothetical protein
MHQGIGLEAFNTMPMRRAVHAIYECCYSVPLAAELCRGRPFADHDELFRAADGLLFGLGEESVGSILQAYPDRLHNDTETEYQIVRDELARINRTRLQRMLGPEGGYDNW